MPIPLPPVVPIPEAFDLPVPTLAPPTFELPKWEPIPVRPKDIPALNPPPISQESTAEEEEEEETKESEEKEEGISRETLNAIQELIVPLPPLPPYDYGEEVTDSQVETVEIFGKFEVPVPKQEIMVTAVATAGAAAVASVGATMVAGKLFNQIVKVAKPVIKIVLNKLAKLKGKPPAPTWARQRLGSRLRIKGRTNWKDGS